MILSFFYCTYHPQENMHYAKNQSEGVSIHLSAVRVPVNASSYIMRDITLWDFVNIVVRNLPQLVRVVSQATAAFLRPIKEQFISKCACALRSFLHYVLPIYCTSHLNTFRRVVHVDDHHIRLCCREIHCLVCYHHNHRVPQRSHPGFVQIHHCHHTRRYDHAGSRTDC